MVEARSDVSEAGSLVRVEDSFLFIRPTYPHTQLALFPEIEMFKLLGPNIPRSITPERWFRRALVRGPWSEALLVYSSYLPSDY